MTGLHRGIRRSLDQDKQILELAGGTGDDTLDVMEAVEGDGQTSVTVNILTLGESGLSNQICHEHHQSAPCWGTI